MRDSPSRRPRMSRATHSLRRVLPRRRGANVSVRGTVRQFFADLPGDVLVIRNTAVRRHFLRRFFLSRRLPGLPVL